MTAIWKYISALFFPEVCAGCETLLRSGEMMICTQCRHELPLTGHETERENEAFKSFYGKLPVENVAALLFFRRKGKVQHIIHKIKYKGREDLGAMIGNWQASLIDPAQWRADFIIPVPLHPRKLKKRGYNQVTAYGKALSAQLGIPYLENVLVKTNYTRTQSGKTFLERTNVKDKGFEVVNSAGYQHCHLILVDDVLTTGATLEACGKALLSIPGAKLSILTMAMTHKE